MKSITLTILACGIFSILSGAAVAATPWEMRLDRESIHAQIFQTSTVGSSVDYERIIATRQSDSQANPFMNWLGSNRGLQQRRNIFARFHVAVFGSYSGGAPVTVEIDPDDLEEPGAEIPEVPIPAAVWLFASGLGFLGWRSVKGNSHQV